MKNTFDQLFPEDLYQSYIIEGNPDSTVLELQKFLESRDDFKNKIPDMLCQMYESVTLDDIHQIKEWHTTRSYSDDQKRICIIGAKFINREAEQSLLKILEEPHHGTHFFLVVPHTHELLDTLKSRAHIITVLPQKALHNDRADEFMHAQPARRIELIAKMIDENKDNETSGGLRFQAIELLNEIEKSLYDRFKKDKGNKDTEWILSEISTHRTYLQTPGASVKMILEHIALVL